jgi:hypothetical protein
MTLDNRNASKWENYSTRLGQVATLRGRAKPLRERRRWSITPVAPAVTSVASAAIVPIIAGVTVIVAAAVIAFIGQRGPRAWRSEGQRPRAAESLAPRVRKISRVAWEWLRV